MKIKRLDMEELQCILNEFGLAYHGCISKSVGLTIVADPNRGDDFISNLKDAFRTAPAVAFKTRIIAGKDYLIETNASAGIRRNDSNGWAKFYEIGYCGYHSPNKQFTSDVLIIIRIYR